VLITTIPKNAKEKICVSIEEYRGSTFIDLRVYWQDEAGKWKPSRKGIALNDECIDLVIDALKKASKKLEG
jgi:hypothetical protein